MSFTSESATTGETYISDRRIFARLKAGVLLRCLQNNHESMGVTLDISAQGLGIVLSDGVTPLSAVEVFLKLPSTKEEFTTLGKIAWCRKVDGGKFRVGIALDKPELMIVSQLLNRLSVSPC
jgi:hypothetical protein